jgi:CheY-like chemotaxis protein
MKVLIAEDDPVVALGLSERVRTLGHEAIGPVSDGEQAVVEAKSSLPDLYLFDIEMPTLDGLAAAVQLAGEGLRQRSDELVKTLEGRGRCTRIRTASVFIGTSASRIPA